MSHFHSQSGVSTPASFDSFQGPTGIDVFEDASHEYNLYQPDNELFTETDDYLICTACGTQFDTPNPALIIRCRICDDPRQFVPPTGQSFTSLAHLKSQSYTNIHTPFSSDQRFTSLTTVPKFGIGQRCIIISTPIEWHFDMFLLFSLFHEKYTNSMVKWDCITFLDSETTEWIRSLGGLAAIVISHPHYYTTHLVWAATFDCPVYLAWEDKSWLNRLDRLGKARTFIESTEEEIEVRGEKSGVLAIKLGGHFPGSLVCLAHGRLLVADTLVTTPSGLGDWSLGPGGRGDGRPRGMNSFVFMWSIPNMIPLDQEEIKRMWGILKKYKFASTHGAFNGVDILDGELGSRQSVKKRVLESMQIQIRSMGWREHGLLKEVVENEL